MICSIIRTIVKELTTFVNQLGHGAIGMESAAGVEHFFDLRVARPVGLEGLSVTIQIAADKVWVVAKQLPAISTLFDVRSR